MENKPGKGETIFLGIFSHRNPKYPNKNCLKSQKSGDLKRKQYLLLTSCFN